MENLRNQAAGNYNYDANGNLIQDVSKDLVNITYDYRDLPTRIEFNLAQDLVLNISDPITVVRTYRALQTITAQNHFVVASGGDVTMQAGSKITLKPGFTAQTGSQFHAQIDPNISSQPGNVLSLNYNQKGERIAKSSEMNGTLYYIRGVDGQIIALLDENDTPLFYNIADVGRLAPGTNESSYYYLTDHLGSIRVIVDESGNVVSHTDYYPFGMAMPGREITNLTNDFYKYNGKQLDDDYGLNWHDYGARSYDAEVGRWFHLDPTSALIPSWSPFVYSFNSPVVFIDSDGEFPYTFHIRAFAPPGAFKGFGFHDDNRGFKTDINVTSRIKHSFTIDPTEMTFTEFGPESDFTITSSGSKMKASPSGTVDYDFLDDGLATIQQEFEGSNPFFYGLAPDIEVETSFKLTEDLKAGTLTIEAMGKSKRFPATESFVVDSKGNSVFIGVGAAYGTPSDLIFSGKKQIFKKIIIIHINKNGIFQNVEFNGQIYSIEEFNQKFKNQDAGPFDRDELED